MSSGINAAGGGTARLRIQNVRWFSAKSIQRCVPNLTMRSLSATLRGMLEVRKTDTFAKWLDGLRDIRARARVQVRIERLAAGHPGDVKPVGEGVSEMRIDYGPGYRIYFKKRGNDLVILLAGGNKTTQPRDIRIALRLAADLQGEQI